MNEMNLPERPTDAPDPAHTSSPPAGPSPAGADTQAPAPATAPAAAVPSGTGPAPAAGQQAATAVLEAPRSYGHDAGSAPASVAAPPIQRNPSPPGVMGVANVVVSSIIGAFWLWIPLSLFFTGIGGLFAAGSGIICLLLWLFLQRGLNHLERMRAEAVYGDRILRPAVPRSPKTGFAGFLDTQWRIIKSSAFWRSTAHHYVKAMLGVVICGVALAGATIGMQMLAGAINPAGAGVYIGTVPTDGSGGWGLPLLNGALGVVFMLVAVLMLWFGPYLDRGLDRGLLPVTQASALRAEVHTLDRARVGAVDAATAERLRIERDLHDGVQPMLVALSMKLGMAKAKFDAEPSTAKQLLTEAHADSKAAITELRQLARGIHPAVLTDRGLDPAISALAARSPIPVDVMIDLPSRPGREAESVAYFVVAESLTNINKHAGATRARVTIQGDGSHMQISVSDDGRGGAVVNRSTSHTGLAGLVDRVTAARGTWNLTSPTGGPTTIVVELPCES